MSIFAAVNVIQTPMEKTQLPEITTEIQAEPWAEGHVAHFITTRAVSQKPKPKRVITTNILPQ